jgi:hypothetical protein
MHVGMTQLCPSIRTKLTLLRLNGLYFSLTFPDYFQTAATGYTFKVQYVVQLQNSYDGSRRPAAPEDQRKVGPYSSQSMVYTGSK